MSYRHLNVNLPPRKLLNTPKINDQRKKEKRLDLYERFKGGMNQLSVSKRQTNNIECAPLLSFMVESLFK